MKKLIISVILQFTALTFAENYSKDTWVCEKAEACEYSDYTGKFTKNCKKYNNVSVYWEYAYDRYNNSLFCHHYGSKKKQCTKIISNDTDKNSNGEDILIIIGETENYIFGNSYLNIIYHTKGEWDGKISYSLCQPLNNSTKNKQQKEIFTDNRDGKKYKTVKIGTQTWMAENLNYYAIGSMCYNNISSNCDKYGRLYDWNTAMKACPRGWHLPSNDDWRKLLIFVDGERYAGKKLKSKNGWNGCSGGNGSDSYGFSALPGGAAWQDSSGIVFGTIGSSSEWWSSSSEYWAAGLLIAYAPSLTCNSDSLTLEYRYEKCLQSIRCIKD